MFRALLGIFHIRALDTTTDSVGPFSRNGFMVSCIDQTVCVYDQVDGNMVVPRATPPPNLPTDALGLCDDVTLVQVYKGILPAVSCVEWH